MKKIFCISGLGADDKIFKNLHISNYDLVYLKWLIPERDESLQSYAKRMVVQITEDEPIILGLSFGGIMCIEISRLIKIKSVILISSIKSRMELPYWMKVVNSLQLHKIIKPYPYKFLAPFQNYNLGVTTAEEIQIVTDYRKNINLKYLRWAINTILNWDFIDPLPVIYHIHGSHDRIFPLKNVKPDLIVRGGGHLMIFNMAEELNSAIASYLYETDKC